MDDFKLVYIFKALDEIRFRLQALEQNTTPARPAEQKPQNYAPSPTGPLMGPREWWLNVYPEGVTGYATKQRADVMRVPGGHQVHVREVL